MPTMPSKPGVAPKGYRMHTQRHTIRKGDWVRWYSLKGPWVLAHESIGFKIRYGLEACRKIQWSKTDARHLKKCQPRSRKTRESK